MRAKKVQKNIIFITRLYRNQDLFMNKLDSYMLLKKAVEPLASSRFFFLCSLPLETKTRVTQNAMQWRIWTFWKERSKRRRFLEPLEWSPSICGFVPIIFSDHLPSFFSSRLTFKPCEFFTSFPKNPLLATSFAFWEQTQYYPFSVSRRIFSKKKCIMSFYIRIFSHLSLLCECVEKPSKSEKHFSLRFTSSLSFWHTQKILSSISNS